MAGQSRRFQKAGYTVPKAFLLIDRRPMIHWVVSSFSPNDFFIFIVAKDHLANSSNKKILESAAKNYVIVDIDAHEQGPVKTSLSADKYLEGTQPLILSYCDIYQEWNYPGFLEKVQGYDGGVTAFRGYHPASFGETYYAYLRVNRDLEMLEIREKQSFTEARHEEFASAGMYYFSSWAFYKKYAEELMSRSRTVNNEYYISLIYELLVADQKKVTVHEIEKFISWGSPEDVQEYLYWSDFFSKHHQANPDLLETKA